MTNEDAPSLPLFTSARERRLWLWTLSVVAANFATLGLARTLAGLLRDRSLLTPVFFLGLFLVVATVLAQGLKTRPGGAEMMVALGVFAVYLLAFARMSIAEERGHLIEYGVIAVFILEALRERAAHGHHVAAPALLAIGATALLGWLDEGVQAVLPNRVYDLRDVGFNTLAAVMAVAASVALARARRPGRSGVLRRRTTL